MALLEVTALEAGYGTGRGLVRAVRGASFTLEPRQVLGVVGESGSGKTTLAHLVMGYRAPGMQVSSGSVSFDGVALLDASAAQLRALWGRRIAMIHQNPLATLTPSMTVGRQLAEAVAAHAELGRRQSLERAIQGFEAVHLPDPRAIAKRYPHQLSAGQRQRVSIALAVALEPDLLILDEPTTNLDATTEAVVLDLLEEIKGRAHSAMLYISHNLGVIARIATRVIVMYAGEIVESATTGALFDRPAHPYTQVLLACLPRPGITKRRGRLPSVKGEGPLLAGLEPGCVFQTRCPAADDACKRSPEWTNLGEGHVVRCWHVASEGTGQVRVSEVATLLHPEAERVLQLEHVSKSYPDLGGRSLDRGQVRAVVDVGLDVRRGSIMGLVGESGSGKTTLLRCITGLARPDAGAMRYLGIDLPTALHARPRQALRAIQMVFQDPESTLNPALTVGENLRRHLASLRPLDRSSAEAAIDRSLAEVRLDASYKHRRPIALSGGEKQRVAIARAFLSAPGLVLCDEPFSALDVSVQASICQLLLDLQARDRNSYVFVSHDLAIVRYMADAIAVMYRGEIVEEGEAESFDRKPVHPYTEALFSATPVPDPRAIAARVRLAGQLFATGQAPKGCIFSQRCPRKLGAVCDETPPAWQSVASRRYRCHIPAAELARLQTIEARGARMTAS